MTKKSFNLVLKILTLFNAFLFGVILVSVDPEKAGFLGLFFFYSTLFLFLFGLFHTIIFFVYERFFSSGSLIQGAQMTTRQSTLLSIFMVGILMLQSWRILNWYNFILFALILSALEYFLLQKKSRYAR